MGADRLSLVVNLGVLLANSIIAYLLARHFGDVAGTRAAIQFEKEKEAKARAAGLRSLCNEVGRIRKLVLHNRGSTSPVGLPTAAFETAFVSGTPGVSAGDELLDAVTDYLVCADRMNVCVAAYLGGDT